MRLPLRRLRAERRSSEPRAVHRSFAPFPFRRRVSGYIVRLTMAMGFSFMPFYVLASARFVENAGCVIYTYMRSLLEHLGLVTLLFTVALFHVPLRRRVLGADAP
jgi:hypothetical protein